MSSRQWRYPCGIHALFCYQSWWPVLLAVFRGLTACDTPLCLRIERFQYTISVRYGLSARQVFIEENGCTWKCVLWGRRSIRTNVRPGNAPIAKVEFYSGTTLIGTATQAPYTVKWCTCVITAKATDAAGRSNITPIAVTVNITAPPVVSLSGGSALYAAPATVRIAIRRRGAKPAANARWFGMPYRNRRRVIGRWIAGSRSQPIRLVASVGKPDRTRITETL